jgi:hypothetical protein
VTRRALLIDGGAAAFHEDYFEIWGEPLNLCIHFAEKARRCSRVRSAVWPSQRAGT